MSEELPFLTIARAAGRIRTRRLSPVELAQAYLDRSGALDPRVAPVTVTAELAREQARRAEHETAARGYRGPLHGIPFALKDIDNTRGILSSAHSRICIANVLPEDASAVSRLEPARAVLPGKLAAHGFARGGPSFSRPGPRARHPWHLAHFTGGSSSGSGAAVAAGPDDRAALSRDRRGLRIGVLPQHWQEELPAHEDHARALEEALEFFRRLGAQLEDRRAHSPADALHRKVLIAESELFSIHHADLGARAQDFGRDFLGRVPLPCRFNAIDYAAALREDRRTLAEARALRRRYDVLLGPGFRPTPGPDAHRTLHFWRHPSLLTPADLLPGPALEPGNGVSCSGLPFGMQWLGGPATSRLRSGQPTLTSRRRLSGAARGSRPEAKQPPIEPEGNEPGDASHGSAARRDFAFERVRRAGSNRDERRRASGSGRRATRGRRRSASGKGAPGSKRRRSCRGPR